MAPFHMIILALTFFFAHSPRPTCAQQQQPPLSIASFSSASQPWSPTQNQILISPNGTFAAGFWPSSPAGAYNFGVWVRNASDQFTVWSVGAIAHPSSRLAVSRSGQLFLNDSSGTILWVVPTVASSNDTALVLKENGDLVFGPWDSFSEPVTDTILPGQSVPQGVVTLQRGAYSLVNATALMFNVSSRYSTPGPIQNLTSDGQLLIGGKSPSVTSDKGSAPLRRLTLDDDGNLRIYSLDSKSGNWNVVWQAIQQICTIPGLCGTNSVCVPDSAGKPSCQCAPGFTRTGVGSECRRKTPYQQRRSRFLPMDFVKFNQTQGRVEDLTPLNFNTCESSCLANSSCVAFGYQFDGSRFCMHHSDPLIGGYWSPGTKMATYIRVAESETDVSNFTGMTSVVDTVCPRKISLPVPIKDAKTTALNLGIICSIFALELLAGVLSFWAFLRKYSKYRDMARTFGLELLPAGGPKRFTFAELKAATNNFSSVLGRGGFGVVYKGELPDRRAVAVKRLKNAEGGEAEFWAEVAIIARMHHLNLVHMWGFCAEKQQRLLVYEYVPNGNLATHLFPQERQGVAENKPMRPVLDWNIRYRIAVGVARAIAYLHEECLEWVLHCDIKPENILLTDDFCPKVADFGLSKLADQEEKVKMSRMRGTRGYMAPEWATKREPITAKADVFSFGMVLLDLVSGIRNFEFRRDSMQSEDCYFPAWAFEKVYLEKNIDEVLDHTLLESFDSRNHFEMAERMVKTAMWCLQERPELRPSMGKVAKMLEGTVEITEPGKPTIFNVGE